MDAVLEPAKKSSRRYVPGRRITPRQQQFAELLATGVSYTQAAKQVGYKSRVSAWEASRNPLVQEYLSSIQSKVRATVAYHVADAMQEAADTMQFALRKENPMAYCKAVELRAKLSGLLIDRVEVFTMDLKGALTEAQTRVINITASKQINKADEQADE